MKSKITLIGLLVTAIILASGCSANFAGKTPTSPRIRFISANESLAADEYEVKGVVVVQRTNTFFDIIGLVKPYNPALEEVFTDDIANELTEKAIALGANAIMNMEIINFTYLPGCLIYLLPIGNASVTMQATAIQLK